MAGVAMRIKADGLKKRISRIGRNARHADPLWDDIGHLSVNSVRENFRVGGRPNKWPANTAATVVRKARSRRGASRRRAIAGNKPLIDTGRLLNSINYRTRRDSVVIGTNVDYGIYHQTGTRRIPARPFMLLQESDQVQIGRLVVRWLRGDR